LKYSFLMYLMYFLLLPLLLLLVHTRIEAVTSVTD